MYAQSPCTLSGSLEGRKKDAAFEGGSAKICTKGTGKGVCLGGGWVDDVKLWQEGSQAWNIFFTVKGYIYSLALFVSFSFLNVLLVANWQWDTLFIGAFYRLSLYM